MDTIQLGTSGLQTSRVAFGCMNIGRVDPGRTSEDCRRAAWLALDTAIECGITFFDHADIYARGMSETVFGEWLAARPGLREKITLQSKAGIRFAGDPEPSFPQRYDFSHGHITRTAEASLRRLRVDALDVLLLHRPDPLVEPEEVARAFDDLHAAGKVRHFGVSNHSAAQIELLRQSVRQPLIANQVELSLLHFDMIDAGIYWNVVGENRSATGDGTLEYCRQNRITLQAWSPLARGLLAGRPVKADDPRAGRIGAAAQTVAEFARAKGVAAETIVIAWLLRHPAGIQPIVGTQSLDRIKACCAAVKTALTREEWYQLYAASRGRGMP